MYGQRKEREERFLTSAGRPRRPAKPSGTQKARRSDAGRKKSACSVRNDRWVEGAVMSDLKVRPPVQAEGRAKARPYNTRKRRTAQVCFDSAQDKFRPATTGSQSLPQNSAEDCADGACLRLHSRGCRED